MISMISFSNMKIQSTSLLSPTIYSNIGGSTIYCSPAAVAGTAKILDISIPTNVSKVRAVVTSPMMCSLSDGWLSLLVCCLFNFAIFTNTLPDYHLNDLFFLF